MGTEGRYRPDFTLWLGENNSKENYVWEHWVFNPDYDIPDRIDGWDIQKIKDYKDDINVNETIGQIGMNA